MERRKFDCLRKKILGRFTKFIKKPLFCGGHFRKILNFYFFIFTSIRLFRWIIFFKEPFIIIIIIIIFGMTENASQQKMFYVIKRK